ncbi:hypothetical protein AB0H43_13575 [Hamadaea sp. NPDC050747]|uniref:hypothetical protein n=1 Tax=Hamadaea sp. NPDC050747 TaxID=3155789 RepID=UPI00340E296A
MLGLIKLIRSRPVHGSGIAMRQRSPQSRLVGATLQRVRGPVMSRGAAMQRAHQPHVGIVRLAASTREFLGRRDRSIRPAVP